MANRPVDASPPVIPIRTPEPERRDSSASRQPDLDSPPLPPPRAEEPSSLAPRPSAETRAPGKTASGPGVHLVFPGGIPRGRINDSTAVELLLAFEEAGVPLFFGGDSKPLQVAERVKTQAGLSELASVADRSATGTIAGDAVGSLLEVFDQLNLDVIIPTERDGRILSLTVSLKPVENVDAEEVEPEASELAALTKPFRMVEPGEAPMASETFVFPDQAQHAATKLAVDTLFEAHDTNGKLPFDLEDDQQSYNDRAQAAIEAAQKGDLARFVRDWKQQVANSNPALGRGLDADLLTRIEGGDSQAASAFVALMNVNYMLAIKPSRVMVDYFDQRYRGIEQFLTTGSSEPLEDFLAGFGESE